MSSGRACFALVLVWSAAGFTNAEQFITGNGGLTVALDAHGRVVSCAWPAPGAHEHAGQTPALLLPDFQEQGETSTLPGAPVVVTDFGEVLTQSVFVHHEIDVLVLEWRTRADTTTIELLQDFVPRLLEVPLTSLVAGLEQDKSFCDSLGSTNTIYEWRPLRVGEPERVMLHHWREGAEPASRLTAQEGVWAGLRISEPAQVVVVDSAAGWKLKVTEEGVSAFLAFGHTHGEVSATLAAAAERGAGSLRQETEQYWTALLSARQSSLIPNDPEVQTHIRDLLLSTSRSTGLTHARGGWSDTQMCAWTVEAFLSAGYPDLAEASLQHYVSGNPARERTELPARINSLGEGIAPSTLIDVEQYAWVLAAAAARLTPLDSSRRNTLAVQWWPRLAECAEFLVRWKHGPQGDIAPSFNYDVLHDTRNQQQRLTVHMGLIMAERVSAFAEAEMPETWAARLRELDILLRFHVLNQEHPWQLEPTRIRWFRNAFEPSHPVWQAEVAYPDQSFGPLSHLVADAAAIEASPYAASIKLVARVPQ